MRYEQIDYICWLEETLVRYTMARHNETGKSGEERAAEYLLAHGYVVRDINWRNGKYELDIVAYKEGLLVVVEVKTRSSLEYMRPEEAVTPAKCRRIIDAADAYVRYFDLPFEVRFDVIALVKKPDGTYDIDHIEDAFFPTLR